MTDDARIGTVAVLASTGDTLEPYAVFWQAVYAKPNGPPLCFVSKVGKLVSS